MTGDTNTPKQRHVTRYFSGVGTGQQILVSGLNDPHRVVLDPVGGQLYWPNFGSDNIQRVNVDGTGHTNLINGLSGPNLLTLDLAGGKMYWTAQGTGDIRRANSVAVTLD